MGTHDGPGIRMVVFLQGCKLKCVYCHNPDTIDTAGGTEVSVDSLVEQALKLKPYFGRKGGVTVSGGEPLLQSRELIPFFERLHGEGIHTAVDTNGRIFNHYTAELLDRYTDLVLLDIKHMTEEGYQAVTGLTNVQTSFDFARHREASGKPMWLRYVLVPGYTDRPEWLHALGQRFGSYRTIERMELLPYHKLGVHKWLSLGWAYALTDTPENTPEQIESAAAILQSYFSQVRVSTTGRIKTG